MKLFPSVFKPFASNPDFHFIILSRRLKWKCIQYNEYENYDIIDNPHCNHFQGAYEMAVHFLGECDRYASLRKEIWGKLYLHPDDFKHETVETVVSFIRISRRFP